MSTPRSLPPPAYDLATRTHPHDRPSDIHLGSPEPIEPHQPSLEKSEGLREKVEVRGGGASEATPANIPKTPQPYISPQTVPDPNSSTTTGSGPKIFSTTTDHDPQSSVVVPLPATNGKARTKTPPKPRSAKAAYSEAMLRAIQTAKANLVNYRHIFLSTGEDEVSPAPFHFGWSDILLGQTGNFAIEAFRESAKTQYVLRSFPFYALSFPDPARDYIVIIKNNTPLAQAKLKEIEQEFESNPALKANVVKVREKSGSVLSIDMKAPGSATGIINVRIEAYGKGASIRGLANIDRRPKIVIIDDPQDLEDSKSDAVLAADWEWFLSDVNFLGQNTRLFAIGNNLGEKCIIERIANDPKALGFTFQRIPVCDENGDPTWPSKYTKEGIARERENYRSIGKLDVWLRERMCQAVADETRIFKREYFRYYNPIKKTELMARCNRFMVVDPASSTSVTADYRAMLVVAVDEDSQWFVLDCSYGRYDTKVMIDEMFRLAIQWDVREVGIEEGILKAAIMPFLTPEMKRRNQFFTVHPVKHGGRRKEERIRMLQPRFANGSIFFPDVAPWLAELETELMAFTMDGMKGLHDDLIDAFAYTEQIARVPFRSGHRPSARYRELPRMANMEAQLI